MKDCQRRAFEVSVTTHRDTAGLLLITMRVAGRDAGAAKVIIDHQTRQTLPALEREQSTTEYPPPLPPPSSRLTLARCGRRRLCPHFVNYSDM